MTNFLGPVHSLEKKKDRDHYAHVQSETCSLTDRIFQDKTSKQQLAPDVIDHLYPNPIHVTQALQQDWVISEYRPMIREHVERRVSFFFQQLIVCYQTRLYFESVGAQDQAQSGEAIWVNVRGEQAKLAVRQAAHSSSNPCLIAYELTPHGRRIEPGFVFLKGTDYYRTVNATMTMPAWINEADSAIDGSQGQYLRQEANTLLNRVSQGELTPDQALPLFIAMAKRHIERAQGATSPETAQVLRYYMRYFNKIEDLIESEPETLERFLDIELRSGTDDARSTQTIFQLRYRMIRECQFKQSALIQKIETLKDSILNQVKRSNGHRKPDNFDAAFKTILIAAARSEENRKRLEKLLNFSPFNFETQLTGSTRTKYTQTKELLTPYQERIRFVALEILDDMRTYRTDEETQRSLTVRTLRHMKGWTQEQLGTQLKAAFPTAAASRTTISNIERGVKRVTEPIAQQFSHVLNVDPGLFMPHFYYE